MSIETTDSKQRDRARTSAAILAAATELFLESGYAAVPISLIAKQANVTKSLIHHHFGDKRGLWLAVKDAAVASYATQQKAVFSAIGTERYQGGIAASAAAYFSFLQKQPEIARMFALVSFDGEFEPGTTERELQTSGIAFVKSLQNSGAVRDDVEADMMMAAFASLIEHWFINRGRFAMLNDLEAGPALDARYFEVVLKILNNGVETS